MLHRHAIEQALDLARMPALARTSVVPPIPPNVIELMRVAAASPQACKAAAAATGEPTPVLIEAARFYLQQVLFRPDADCYRILGIQPGASRAAARNHMRWLLQWLHPDHNSGWDGAYADRVLNAWREVSAPGASAAEPSSFNTPAAAHRAKAAPASVRLPWIERPIKGSRAGGRRLRRRFAAWALPAGAMIVLLALLSAVYYFGPDKGAATTLPVP